MLFRGAWLTLRFFEQRDAEERENGDVHSDVEPNFEIDGKGAPQPIILAPYIALCHGKSVSRSTGNIFRPKTANTTPQSPESPRCC